MTPNLLCLYTSDWIGISQVLATVLVGIATILVYLKITKISKNTSNEVLESTTKHNQFIKLNDDLNRLIDYIIQYPYFDDNNYKETYPLDLNSSNEELKTKALRYEAYAIVNFNFISDLITYFERDESKMEIFCNYKELIISNKYYWNHRVINQSEKGYESIEDIVNRVLGNVKT